MASSNILLIDDDALLRRSLAFNLERAGFHASTAANAEDGLAMARGERPGLILLDIGLPGMDGLEALRLFREHMGIPVIFLTSRRRELDQVLGLELGADDYVTKPFDFDVLVARIKNVLRRAAPKPTPETRTAPLVLSDLTIDTDAHQVTVRGKPVELPRLEFDILYTLALEPGKVLSVDDLLARVWGAEYQGESQVVYVHIRWLREKIEDDPHHPKRITSVRGVGYKLEVQEA